MFVYGRTTLISNVRGPGQEELIFIYKIMTTSISTLVNYMLGIGTSSSCMYKLMKHQHWLLHLVVVIINSDIKYKSQAGSIHILQFNTGNKSGGYTSSTSPKEKPPTSVICFVHRDKKII